MLDTCYTYDSEGMENGNFDKKFQQYLYDCSKNINTKCAIIVTDKQCAITTLNEINFIKQAIFDNSHNDLIEYLENKIHFNNNTSGWESYKLHDAYLLLEGPELKVSLPFSGYLSIKQAGFLIDILADICKFNQENNDLISIDIISSTDYKTYHTHNLKIIGEYILSQITEIYITSEERIIGKTSINSEINKSKVYEKH